MDYNDFSERLKRTLNSLNARFNDDIEVFVTNVEKVTINPDNSKTTTINISYSFGKESYETIMNKIFIILYNLSSLKDHLKNILNKKGINQQEVEDEINNSLHMQVLIDIVNQEKHGSPLKKTNRSNKNPKIVKAQQGLRTTITATPQNPEVESAIFFTKTGIEQVGDGTQQMVITAEIVDGNDNKLFSLDELLDVSYEKFLNIANKHNCS